MPLPTGMHVPISRLGTFVGVHACLLQQHTWSSRRTLGAALPVGRAVMLQPASAPPACWAMYAGAGTCTDGLQRFLLPFLAPRAGRLLSSSCLAALCAFLAHSFSGVSTGLLPVLHVPGPAGLPSAGLASASGPAALLAALPVALPEPSSSGVSEAAASGLAGGGTESTPAPVLLSAGPAGRSASERAAAGSSCSGAPTPEQAGAQVPSVLLGTAALRAGFFLLPSRMAEMASRLSCALFALHFAAHLISQYPGLSIDACSRQAPQGHCACQSLSACTAHANKE